MKEIKEIKEDRVAKALNSRTAHRLEIGLGIVILVIAVVMIILGSVHATSSPVFTIDVQNSGNIYTISASTNFTMPNGTSAEMIVISSAGSVMIEHNFTSSYVTVLTLYQSAIVEISYQGQIVQEKVITAVVPTTNSGGILGSISPLSVIISMGFTLVAMIITTWAFKRSIKGGDRDKEMYNEDNYGADVKSLKILSGIGKITIDDEDRMRKLLPIVKERGLPLTLKDLVGEKNASIIDAIKESYGEPKDNGGSPMFRFAQEKINEAVKNVQGKKE